MRFLTTHAHVESQYATAEELESLEASQKDNDKDLVELGITQQKQESISQKFKLSQNAQAGALSSVVQQLEIWESSMSGFTEKPGSLLRFKKKEQMDAWKRYATQYKINYAAFGGSGQQVKVVVDNKYQEKAYKFMDTLYK